MRHYRFVICGQGSISRISILTPVGRIERCTLLSTLALLLNPGMIKSFLPNSGSVQHGPISLRYFRRARRAGHYFFDKFSFDLEPRASIRCRVIMTAAVVLSDSHDPDCCLSAIS